MRQRMMQIIHLDRERQRLVVALKKEPDDVQLLKDKSVCDDRILGMLVEEVRDLGRDVQSAHSAAKRPRWM